MMRIKLHMLLPCKNMTLKKDLIVKCKLTGNVCVLWADTGSFGKHIWDSDLERCPGYKLDRIYAQIQEEEKWKEKLTKKKKRRRINK